MSLLCACPMIFMAARAGRKATLGRAVMQALGGMIPPETGTWGEGRGGLHPPHVLSPGSVHWDLGPELPQHTQGKP